MEKYSKELLEINKRFVEVVEKLSVPSRKTEVIKQLGYKTTRQYYNIVKNQSLVSTSALYNLTSKYRVNPNWLFNNVGHAFSKEVELLSKVENERNDLMRILKVQIEAANTLKKEKDLIVNLLSKQLYGDSNTEVSEEDLIQYIKEFKEGS